METVAIKRLLRIPSVLDRVALSRSSWLREVKAGTAPAPLKISPGIAVWPEEQIDAWIAARVAAALEAQKAPVEGNAPGESVKRRGRPRKSAVELRHQR